MDWHKSWIGVPTKFCNGKADSPVWLANYTNNVRQIQLETGSCHFIYTKYMWNSKVNIFLKGGAAISTPPPPPTHTALEISLSQPTSHLQSPEIHQMAFWCFLWGYVLETKGPTRCWRQKKMSNTSVFKNCWHFKIWIIKAHLNSLSRPLPKQLIVMY